MGGFRLDHIHSFVPKVEQRDAKAGARPDHAGDAVPRQVAGAG